MIYIYFKINYRIQITSEMVGKKYQVIQNISLQHNVREKFDIQKV